MKTITHSQFISLLQSAKGAFPVGVSAHVDAKARKTGNPHPIVYKDVEAVGFCGADYGKAVAREGERQGVDASEFVAQARPWGEWLVPNKVATHKGAHYLRLQTTPGQRAAQPAHVEAYRDDKGRYLSPDVVRPFLPAKRDTATQAHYGVGANAGEGEGQIDVREYKFDNIAKVRMGGEEYALVPDGGEVPAYHTTHKGAF